MDMQKYWKAYIAFAIIIVALVAVVYYRTVNDNNVKNELREMRLENQQNTQMIIDDINQLGDKIDVAINRTP